MMIHGFGGSYMNFDALSKLMKNDYRVIRVDLPGFGLSDFPAVKEHEDFIEYLKMPLLAANLSVVPAKAGTQVVNTSPKGLKSDASHNRTNWVPAFAGTTMQRMLHRRSPRQSDYAAINSRRTNGRIPPCLRYSTSIGESTRRVTVTFCDEPSLRWITSVTSCIGFRLPPSTPSRS